MKNNILIIYKSSTGFTKKYAEIISSELNCTLATYKNITPEIIQKYNTIVFGSRAHAGTIDGYKKIKKMLGNYPYCKFILFVTGATPSSAKDVINEFWQQNLTPAELAKIPHFYMPGGLCYEKMSLIDKIMMKGLAVMLKKKKDKNSYEKELENAIKNSYDISSGKYATPLISFLKSTGNNKTTNPFP
ncbi:MAG: flavodoxin domain-containing protein [Lachnospiraceae bacterium]